MEATDFSLTDRGPAGRLLVRTSSRRGVRAGVLALLAWLPLLLLRLVFPPTGPEPAIRFVEDLSVHVRFLLVLPLLVLAEGTIGARTCMVVSGFLASGLVRPEQHPRFQQIVRRANRLADSAVAEGLLVAVTFLLFGLSVRRLLNDGVVFWFEHPGAVAQQLSPAGWWYVAASAALWFLFLRLVWRYALWCWLLHRLSRLDLYLVGTHPDRAGGLGFVNIGQAAFALVPLAASCVVAAGVGTEILQAGVPLQSLAVPLLVFVLLCIAVGLLPFPAFLQPLLRVKRRGLIEYGKLATAYTQTFEQKWVRGGAAPDEPLLGSGDIQSLADIGGSFERLNAMKPTPLDLRTLIAFAACAVLPLLPLVLTVVPLQDLVKMLVRAVL